MKPVRCGCGVRQMLYSCEWSVAVCEGGVRTLFSSVGKLEQGDEQSQQLNTSPPPSTPSHCRSSSFLMFLFI